MLKNLTHEREAGFPEKIIAGVDEVGRGALAGPVVAAAVIWSPQLAPWDGLRDSKKLTPAQRVRHAARIRRECRWALGMASACEIDEHNILQASLLAMARAVARLSPAPDCVLVDGRDAPNVPMATRTIIGGDDCAPSIAAASIIAKAVRDRLMARLARRYPAYDWASNKGYGTKHHTAALARAGVSPQHRRSFAPVREMCG